MNLNTPVTFDSYKDIRGYIINLDREPSRYVKAATELSNLGFSDLCRWRAVDAQNANMSQLFEEIGVYDINLFKEYTNKGQWACTLSHINLLKKFVAGGETHCLVFEDDVIAHSAFHKHADFLDISWADFELLSLGGVFVYCDYEGVRYRQIAQVKATQGSETHISNAHYWQTHAYLCSVEFAEKAIKRFPEWVAAGGCPYIDHYYTESGYFETKLITAQNTENLSNLRLNVTHAKDLCGILYQDNAFKSTIQSY